LHNENGKREKRSKGVGVTKGLGLRDDERGLMEKYITIAGVEYSDND